MSNTGTRRVLTLGNQVPSATQQAVTAASKSILPSTSHLVGNYSSDGLTASVATSKLKVGSPRGLYRILYYAVASASTVGVLTLTLSWSDGVATQTATPISAVSFAANQESSGQVVIFSGAAQDIQFSTTVTGTLTYNLRVVLEQIY